MFKRIINYFWVAICGIAKLFESDIRYTNCYRYRRDMIVNSEQGVRRNINKFSRNIILNSTRLFSKRLAPGWGLDYENCITGIYIVSNRSRTLILNSNPLYYSSRRCVGNFNIPKMDWSFKLLISCSGIVNILAGGFILYHYSMIHPFLYIYGVFSVFWGVQLFLVEWIFNKWSVPSKPFLFSMGIVSIILGVIIITNVNLFPYHTILGTISLIVGLFQLWIAALYDEFFNSNN